MKPTSPAAYKMTVRVARDLSPLVASATTAPEELPDAVTGYYVSEDGRSGFGVTIDGTLIALFSLVKGRGDALVAEAIAAGARKLDCFDGYLPSLYARHGFIEVGREANWTPGEPDVVFMERA